MKKILLTQGKHVLVDDANYNWLNRFKWHAHRKGNTWYACRSCQQVVGARIHIKMHRLILRLRPGDGKYTDHIDGNGLNNQQFNIRICNNQQNSFNRKSNRDSSSKFKGVSWHKGDHKWQARIRNNGKQKHLGNFDDEIRAAKAYDIACVESRGHWAKTNLPRSNYGLQTVQR